MFVKTGIGTENQGKQEFSLPNHLWILSIQNLVRNTNTLRKRDYKIFANKTKFYSINKIQFKTEDFA